MTSMSEFPTTRTALEEIREGCYDIVQLSKKVDEAVNGSKRSNAGIAEGNGTRTSSRKSPADTTRGHDASAKRSSTPEEDSLFHLHSFTWQLALVPPIAQFTRFTSNLNDSGLVPNEDRTRFDTILDKIKNKFEPFEPFDLVHPTFDSLYIPLTVDGQANKRAAGFNVLLPSTLKPQNIKPLLQGLVFPDTHLGNEWLIKSSTWDARNWIHAALALDPRMAQTRNGAYRPEDQCIFLKSGIKAYWESDEGRGTTTGSLSLVLTIDCFIDVQRLWEPLPTIGHDLMGLIYHSLFPSTSSGTAMTDSEARAESLRYFYSCLRPAPPVPYSRSVQPSNMPSKLLPFQSRTVAWLLQRERAPVDDTEACQDPPGFWSTHGLGSMGALGYRRLTGELVKLDRAIAVPDRKGKGRAVDHTQEELELIYKDRALLPTLLDLSQVKGSMLCEEMGLGKTVEAIALILLNRHPLSNKRDHAVEMQVVAKTEEVPSSPIIERPPAPAPTAGSVGRGRGKGRVGGRRVIDRRRDSVIAREAALKAKPEPKLPTIDLATDLDLSRNPTVLDWWHKEKEAFSAATVYDEKAEINVSQVAATLIVTPPSLLKQWVAEMATHAPGLRVCVYTGWKGLLAGVQKRGAQDVKARNQSTLTKRKNANDKKRAQTIRKYQRGSSGVRVKVEIEDDDDSDDEDAIDGESLQFRTQRLFVEYVLAHDVVITTYNDLSTDLTVANKAPDRSRRSNVDYRKTDRPRSPLVMAEWFRVIMDEVQLCGDSSSAANMVSLIPRKHALAVSGTPAKTDIKDLMGSLRFLRVPVLPYDSRLWHRLQQAPMRPAFDGLFQTIAVRTTKKEVAGEFDIPHQTRLVVPIELSEIEMHYYNDTLERQRVVLGLPADPADARPDGWYLDRALFRTTLQNLRQICTHIQVGQMAGGPPRMGNRVNRLRLGKELLGLGEVLKKMKEDNATEISIASRAQLRAMIRKVQLILADQEKPDRERVAEALYYKVETKSQQVLESLRQELAELVEAREGNLDDEDTDGDEESSTADQGLSQHQLEQRRERMHVRNSIREILLILHQCYFFQGDFYHVQEKTDSEVECYNKAEAVRKEIFTQPLKAANDSIAKLEQKIAAGSAIQSVVELQTSETDRSGGILSQEIMNQSNELLKIMNENALLVFSWREKIIELLKSPIDAEKDLPTTEEGQDVVDPEKEYYAQALQAQGQVEAYLIAYAAAIADRREMMSEERSVLAKHDARVKKLRTTKAAAQALADSEIPADVPDDVAEQAAGLMAERQALKDAREFRDCQRPLKALIVALNPIALGEHRREEVAIARNAIHDYKAYITEQSEKVDDLNKELDIFRTTFNRRVQYFAAYQIVSDSVTAPTYKDLKAEINEADRDILAYETQIARCQVKSRYLKHLGDKEQQGTEEEMRDDCIICLGSSDDAHGILLPCGHFFCVSCFDEYRKSATGRKCPACRVEIDPREGTSFRMGPKAIVKGPEVVPATASTAQEEEPNVSEPVIESEVDPALVEEQKRQADLARLNMMTVKTRQEIASMDMMGEFGSKINFLIKHLLWYRIKDKSARHVVFSNWSDSLFIVIQALQRNGISFVSFDKGGKIGGDVVGKFLKNESITVFLLHAEKESAGLTLTSCRIVHLLEPVLKHSFELQAIGRVDRLGQKEETTVYCYSTNDTVEARILSQGVRNGSSIYLKEEEQGDKVVEDMDNVASAAHKGGDIGVGNEEEMLKLIML